MSAALMCVAISFAVLNNCLLHKFSNRGIRNTGEIFLFNGAVSAGWCLLLLAWSLLSGGVSVDLPTFLYGAVYGVILCAFLLFKTLAMTSGPVSLTTLISSCAFLVAVGYSVLFAGDSISARQIAGIIVLLPALYLCLAPGAGQKNGEKYSVRWLIFSLLFFLAGGGVGVFYRVFGKSPVSGEVDGMMLSAAATAALLFCVCGFIINLSGRAPLPRLTRVPATYAVLCAVTSCVYIRLNISLANVIPGAIFFSVSNGAIVMLSALAGRVFFGERLRPAQLAGLALGLAAILLIGC